MGLIKNAIKTSVGSALSDQWKEFFYCEAMDKSVMVTKGQKRISGRSSNIKASDNIISNGSGIAVADGQCMIIVEQGKIVEVCAEPGQFTYNSSTEPSIFAGSLGKSIIDTFKTMGKRFTYGGDTGKDQRVYYFNTKELIDNKFGTPNPIPFRVVDSKIGLDIDVSVRCSGVYSYKITNPLLFYANVCGNIESEYRREMLDSQLKNEFISALQPAFGRLSDMELRPNQIVSHNTELENAMNETLSAKWSELRGLKVVSIALGSVTLPPEDAEMIKQAQRTAIMRDPTMAAATLVDAQADAMKSAASNNAGAMNGFIGMGLAMNAGGGVNAQNLYAMGQQQQAALANSWKCSCGATATGKFCPECGSKKPEPVQNNSWKCSCGATATGKFCPECGSKKPEPVQDNSWKCACGATATGKFCPECGSKKPTEDDNSWKCSCGTTATGNFCPECGSKKPSQDDGSWKCSCGAENKGKFCPNCGSKKPESVKPEPVGCSKCGWMPEDPAQPPKFCPECGNAF